MQPVWFCGRHHRTLLAAPTQLTCSQHVQLNHCAAKQPTKCVQYAFRFLLSAAATLPATERLLHSEAVLALHDAATAKQSLYCSNKKVTFIISVNLKEQYENRVPTLLHTS